MLSKILRTQKQNVSSSFMLPIHYGATGNSNQNNESSGLASSSSFKAFYKQLTKPFF